MQDTYFCERNVKGWVTLVVVSAVLVLTFSIWSAADKGSLTFFNHRPKVKKQKTVLSAGSKAGNISPPPAQPVAFNTPYSQVPPRQIQAPLYPSPVDAVTMASRAGGGLKFIGNTRIRNNSNSFHRAADIIRPCVVNINAIRPNRFPLPITNNLKSPRFIDPFDGVPDKMIGLIAFESVGSGVIVDPAGYLVTNHHVVAGATTIYITRFQQEKKYPARIVAADPRRDLALLKIMGDGPFPAATLADSSKAEVGDWVLAVGNPFGLEHTVTAGIISGIRSSMIIGGVNFKGLIQTDAPINKGSSGGPLVNMNGQVIGINSAIYAPTGVFNGTGFAIPSNRVGAFVARYLENDHNLPVAFQKINTPVTSPKQLKAGGAWLGIGVIDMTPDLAAKLSFPHAGGVYVSSLVLDSPADEAEISRGDIITAVSGRPVQNCKTLQAILAGLTPGQSVSVTTWQGGKTDKLTLTTRVGRIIAR